MSKCTNRSDITLSFRENRVNNCDFRATVLVSKLKTPCTTFGMWDAMIIAFKRQNSSNRREITLSYRQNWENDCDLRATVLVSKLKTPCTTFGMWNAMKIAFKRRNYTNTRVITSTFPQNRVNYCDSRAAMLASKLKTPCTTFVV